jgi:hypothetical protein
VDDKVAGFIKSEEAGQFTESIGDPITKLLVKHANYHLYRRLAEKRLPEGQFDMRFYSDVMAEMFSDRDTVKRMLAGERVGAFFDEEP